jgi:hypothetical protein
MEALQGDYPRCQGIKICELASIQPHPPQTKFPIGKTRSCMADVRLEDKAKGVQMSKNQVILGAGQPLPTLHEAESD